MRFEVESSESTTFDFIRPFLIPIKTSHTRGISDTLTDVKRRDLLNYYIDCLRVWKENNDYSAIIDHFADLASVSETIISNIIKSNEYIQFLDPANKQQSNKPQFHELVARIIQKLSKKSNLSIIYIATRQWPLFPFHNVDNKKQS